MNKRIKTYELDVLGFWLQWVAANTLGMAIAFMGSFLLMDVALRFITGETLDDLMNREDLGFLISLSVIFTVSGAGIGLMQWLVLRRHIASASGGRWVLANALGFAVVVILSFVLYGRIPEVVNEVVHNILGGAVLGIIQSQMLKQQVPHAGWWVAVSSGGMVIAGLGSYFLGGGTTNMVIGIALMAACTGVFLVWLLRLPSPEVAPVTQATSAEVRY